MPDVGLLRTKAYQQRNLPEDEQDDDLDEMAADDLAAYVRIIISLSLKSLNYLNRNFHSLLIIFWPH